MNEYDRNEEELFSLIGDEDQLEAYKNVIRLAVSCYYAEHSDIPEEAPVQGQRILLKLARRFLSDSPTVDERCRYVITLLETAAAIAKREVEL